RQYERSEPMRNPPRKRRFQHALRGHWDRFPVSPEPYAEDIEANFVDTGYYSHRESFGLSSTLDRYVEKATKLQKAGKSSEAQALLRAWMTVVIELMVHADDSYGSIGMSFDDGFAAYLKLSLDK